MSSGEARRRRRGSPGSAGSPSPSSDLESPECIEQEPTSWSGIPLELGSLVLGRLHAHVDRVRFAVVCRQWREAAQQTSLPPPLPLLALKDGSFYSMPRGEPLHFAGYHDDFVTTSDNWLVYKRWNCMLLEDPFSRATMTLPVLPTNNDPGGMDFVVIKLVVCSPHLIAALFQGTTTFSVGVCRPGASSWSVARDLAAWIFDIAFYKEKLYAINYLQDLLPLEISMDDNTGEQHIALGERVIRGGHVHLDQHFFRVLYLVESHGSLLMVHRTVNHGHIQREGQIHTFAEQFEDELEVFEANFEQSRWDDMLTLDDDEALFLGSCSRVVCMPKCDFEDGRFWLLDDYKKDEFEMDPFAGAGDMVVNDAEDKNFSCPLPKISWKGQYACAGAMWLFPSN